MFSALSLSFSSSISGCVCADSSRSTASYIRRGVAIHDAREKIPHLFLIMFIHVVKAPLGPLGFGFHAPPSQFELNLSSTVDTTGWLQPASPSAAGGGEKGASLERHSNSPLCGSSTPLRFFSFTLLVFSSFALALFSCAFLCPP